MTVGKSSGGRIPFALAFVSGLLFLLLLLGAPTQSRADNCSDDATPCSPRCVRLGNLYDQRYQALERVNRRLERNGRQLKRAESADPVNRARLRKLRQKDAYLRTLYDRRHKRLMKVYRRLLSTC